MAWVWTTLKVFRSRIIKIHQKVFKMTEFNFFGFVLCLCAAATGTISLKFQDFQNLALQDSFQNLTFILEFKGSPDPSYVTFEINVGKRWIRHGTTLNLNDEFLNLNDDWRFKFRIVPPLSDIDLKNCLSLTL